MSEQTISRRQFLRVSALAVAGATLAACAKEVAPEATATPQAAAATATPAETKAEPTPTPEAEAPGNQAPMILAMVESGALAPLEERIPANIYVHDGPDSPGQYGGTVNRLKVGGGNTAWIWDVCFAGHETLIQYDENLTGTEPLVAESWQVSDDGLEYTLNLRKGIYWSDGEPMTADDLQFWYEDVFLNELIGLPEPFAQTTGFEKVDDFTVKFMLDAINVNFPKDVGHSHAVRAFCNPEHYGKQFHEKYNPDVQALVDAAGLDTWDQLYNQKCGHMIAHIWEKGGTPQIGAYIGDTEGEITGATMSYRAARNPYYWKLDSAGQQLPYIDYVAHQIVEDPETIPLLVSAGDVDYQEGQGINSTQNLPVYLENAEAGEYEVVYYQGMSSNTVGIFIHQTPLDPMHAEIHSNKDFRIGMSYAINRQEIIDTLFNGLGEPRQVALLPESPYYVGGEHDYVEYDVDLANEYLDKVLPEKGPDGFRLGPDGKTYTMINVVVDEATRMDMSEMLQRYWEQVGIKTEIRAFTRDAADQMYANRDFDIRLWGGGNGLDPTTQLSPWSAASPGLQGAGIYEESYGVGWSYWIRDQIDGTTNELSVEPPEAWKKQYELVATALQTVDVEERTELFKQAFKIFVDDFVMIGVSLPPPSFRIAQKDLKNVYLGSFGWPEGLERPLKVWATYYSA